LAFYFEPDGHDPRFDLFSVSKKQGTLVNRFLQSGVWSDWNSISQDARSAPAGCLTVPNRTDVWFKQGEKQGIMHSLYFDDGAKYGDEPSLLDQTTATRPGVACRSVRDAFSHDIVVYEPADGSATHRQWANDWKDAKNMGGKFIGDPYVIATSTSRIDFLGIGDDKEMYHFSWTRSGGHSKLESLGGKFASMPSAVVIGPDGARVDVLAVGTDGKLKHRVMTQSQWNDDWENLDIAVRGAPNLVLFKNMIHLFADAPGGQLMHAFWDPSTGALEWKPEVNLKSVD